MLSHCFACFIHEKWKNISSVQNNLRFCLFFLTILIYFGIQELKRYVYLLQFNAWAKSKHYNLCFSWFITKNWYGNFLSSTRLRSLNNLGFLLPWNYKYIIKRFHFLVRIFRRLGNSILYKNTFQKYVGRFYPIYLKHVVCF